MIFKRGMGFDFVTTLTKDRKGNVPVTSIDDWPSWSAESQIREDVGGVTGALVATLVCEIIPDVVGAVRVYVPDQDTTKTWKLTKALWDVVLINAAGHRIQSNDFIKMQIINGATQP